ncbi:MAG: tRNA dihydrouridine synthase DusB, partial [Clostridiales bacterium]|nr:tRNA dihydrouridine synthase DusB [Clostridiales bacterium]
VTVKIRAGWDAGHINAVELARRCEAAGAAAVTVHGRTRAQMYAPPVDLTVIRQVKEAVKIPVIGNGDIASPQDAARMLEQTGCDFLMVGRAAMGAPWIFSQIDAWLDHGQYLPPPPVAQRMAYLLRQAQRMIEYKGERIAAQEIRKHAGWYMRGLRGAAEYRRIAGTISCLDDLARLCLRAAEENPEE